MLLLLIPTQLQSPLRPSCLFPAPHCLTMTIPSVSTSSSVIFNVCIPREESLSSPRSVLSDLFLVEGCLYKRNMDPARMCSQIRNEKKGSKLREPSLLLTQVFSLLLCSSPWVICSGSSTGKQQNFYQNHTEMKGNAPVSFDAVIQL